MEYYFQQQSSSESGGEGWALHNAAESGDVEQLQRLLHVGFPDVSTQDGGIAPAVAQISPSEVNERDEDNLTPLHLAILNGHLACVQALLENGARQVGAEGSKPIHMAVQMGQLPNQAHFALECTRLLLSRGASPYDRDDFGRTSLHWAGALGLAPVITLLLEHGTKERASQRGLRKAQEERRAQYQAEQAAAAAQAPAEGEDAPMRAPEPDPTLEPDVEVPPPLVATVDRSGQTAMHLAARAGHRAALEALVEPMPGEDGQETADVEKAVERRDRTGMTALHKAAEGGHQPCALLLQLQFPSLVNMRCKKGRTAGDLALRRGYGVLARELGVLVAPAGGKVKLVEPGTNDVRDKPTLLVAPPLCSEHYTFSMPFVRGATDAPPENVHRLKVLLHPATGILRAREFDGRLQWDKESPLVALADVTRVHEWSYIKHLKQVCAGIPDEPSIISHLDGDTAISHKTYLAALAAAGAVTHAIDKVMSGEAKNAFCAVRPPGHHAGPTGVVTSQHDPNGSHGFCLLNNVAIGASYALNVYRHHGIRKVAILDFDVHHGNGTEACVSSTVPTTLTHHFKTPFSEGIQRFPVWRPWLDEGDDQRVFFASVQGYGRKAPGIDAYVYPGSGATCDTRPEGKLETAVDAAGHAVLEDPDNEFVYHGGEMPPAHGPRIINIGVEHPGPESQLWRRGWRDKILPALVKFSPDMILVSAGFDAHRKDEINFGYLSVLERDFEWLSDQIVQVANRCCGGRVVSVLEGGYRIQGGVVSAFARSVAAHVRAMCDTHGSSWDPAEAAWEHEREKQRNEASRPSIASPHTPGHGLAPSPLANPGTLDPLPTGSPPGAVSAALDPLPAPSRPLGPASSEPPSLVAAPSPVSMAPAGEMLGEGMGEMGEPGGDRWEEDRERKRRRRSAAPVDYKALDAKMREEAEAKKRAEANGGQ